MALQFLLISPGFNSFLLLRDEKNSKCGPVLAVIKCIYLPPTYLHLIQDIKDRWLLLMSSMSFVDLPLQEHRMTEKHHMDQNPYISSLCPKSGVVTDNMTWGDNVAQSPGPAEPKWGRLAPPPWPVSLGLASFWNLSSTHVNLSRQKGYPTSEMWWCHKAWPSGQVKWSAGLTSGPPEPKLQPRHRLKPLINTLLLFPT
jgi:hypothetical protein